MRIMRLKKMEEERKVEEEEERVDKKGRDKVQDFLAAALGYPLCAHLLGGLL